MQSTIAGFCSRVSLPEEPPTAPPQNVIASGRTNQSIMIQWQPPPESHQNGILKGYIIRYRAILGPSGLPTLRGEGLREQYRLKVHPCRHKDQVMRNAHTATRRATVKWPKKNGQHQ